MLCKKLNSIEAKRILKIDAIVKRNKEDKDSDGKAEAIWTEILKAGKSKFVEWVKGLPEKIWDKSFDAILGKVFKGEESGGGCCCCGGGGGSIINEPATSSRPGSEETSTNGETRPGRNRSGGKFMKGLRKVGKVGGKASHMLERFYQRLS